MNVDNQMGRVERVCEMSVLKRAKGDLRLMRFKGRGCTARYVYPWKWYLRVIMHDRNYN